MHQVLAMLLASLVALPGTALAEPVPTPPTTGISFEHRLSPEEIESVLNDAARRRELAESSDERLPPPIHGEIGFSIGTGGYRSAFGTAVVPLPGAGVAILSFGTDRLGSEPNFHNQDR